MAKFSQLCIIILLLVICIDLSPNDLFALEKKFQWSTRLSFSETYDDNIDLDPDNEKSDWVTTIGPGLSLAVLFEETDIVLNYDLAFAFYAKNDENNAVRHSLKLTGLKGIPIAEQWTLDLEESFLVSEDPLEISEQTTSTQRSRDRYYSNRAGARVNYLFGREDSLSFGFLHRLYITDDPDSQDSQAFGPEAIIEYWFNVRHGLRLSYEYTRATFSGESNNFDRHTGSTTYTYRYSPSTLVNLSYRYQSVVFDGNATDYSIHSARLGLTQQVTEHSSWSISGGYFFREKENNDHDDGFDGSASLNRQFERGSLTLNAAGGYREQYIQAENLGFSRFYKASVGFEYQLMEKLHTSISGFYQRDEYRDTTPKRDDDLWQGRIALNYPLLPWLNSSLSYQHRRLDSSESEDEYVDNRVTLNLVIFYTSEPKPF